MAEVGTAIADWW